MRNAASRAEKRARGDEQVSALLLVRETCSPFDPYPRGISKLIAVFRLGGALVRLLLAHARR